MVRNHIAVSVHLTLAPLCMCVCVCVCSWMFAQLSAFIGACKCDGLAACWLHIAMCSIGCFSVFERKLLIFILFLLQTSTDDERTEDILWRDVSAFSRLTRLETLVLSDLSELPASLLSTSLLPLSLRELSLTKCTFEDDEKLTFSSLLELPLLRALSIYAVGVSGSAPWETDESDDYSNSGDEENKAFLPVPAALSLLALRTHLTKFIITDDDKLVSEIARLFVTK